MGMQQNLGTRRRERERMGSLAAGVQFNHIARDSDDINRLAQFYQEILGFERVDSPKFSGFEVVWLRLKPSFFLHIIERKPGTKLPVSSSDDVCRDPSILSRSHHLAFSVSNFDSFVEGLKEKGIRFSEMVSPNGRTRQVFFFDPDGNGVEVTTGAME
ncbi:glyoxylase I 4 [Nymphaea colorata]|nr:glyoxylase I 4 [Nymphaea colorata]